MRRLRLARRISRLHLALLVYGRTQRRRIVRSVRPRSRRRRRRDARYSIVQGYGIKRAFIQPANRALRSISNTLRYVGRTQLWRSRLVASVLGARIAIGRHGVRAQKLLRKTTVLDAPILQLYRQVRRRSPRATHLFARSRADRTLFRARAKHFTNFITNYKQQLRSTLCRTPGQRVRLQQYKLRQLRLIRARRPLSPPVLFARRGQRFLLQKYAYSGKPYALGRLLRQGIRAKRQRMSPFKQKLLTQKTKSYAAQYELRSRATEIDLESSSLLGEAPLFRTILSIQRPARLTFGDQLDIPLRTKLGLPVRRRNKSLLAHN